MSFDEQPDGDIHGECAHEIHTLQSRIRELEAENQRYRMALERIVTMPKSHEAVRLAVMVLENKDE